jgi:hypothetical protein
LINCKDTDVDHVYMRWFLHALPYEKSREIFKLSASLLHKGGLISVEVRSKNDKNLTDKSIYDHADKSYKTTHKRWLYDKDLLENMASENNLTIVHFIETADLSVNKETENSLLIRCILKKVIYISRNHENINYFFYV